MLLAVAKLTPRLVSYARSQQKPRSSAITTSRRKLDWSSGPCSCEVMLPPVEPCWPGLRPMLELTDSDSLPVAPKPFSHPQVPSLACKNLPDRSRFRTRLHVFALFPANSGWSHVSRNCSASYI